MSTPTSFTPYTRATFLGQTQHALRLTAQDGPKAAGGEIAEIVKRVSHKAFEKHLAYVETHTSVAPPRLKLREHLTALPMYIAQDWASFVVHYPVSTTVSTVAMIALFWSYPITTTALAGIAYLFDFVLD